MSRDKGQIGDIVPTCPHTKGQGTNWGQIGDTVPSRGQGTLGPLYIGGRLSPSLHARVTTHGDTQRQHSATHSHDSTRPSHMAPPLAPPLALRPANAPGWARVADALFRLANARIGRWTVWTSNLTHREISDSIDARLASRLIRDGNKGIRITAPDYALRNRKPAA